MRYIHSEETLEVPENGEFIYQVIANLCKLELHIGARRSKDKRQKRIEQRANQCTIYSQGAYQVEDYHSGGSER